MSRQGDGDYQSPLIASIYLKIGNWLEASATGWGVLALVLVSGVGCAAAVLMHFATS